jgi:hypothetical protein
MAQNGLSGDKSLSTKRQGTDKNDCSSIIRSGLWLEDGNLVIQAEATQFGVHQSVLSMHSTVLHDCFGIPQPKEQEIVEGCPVVHLSDSVADIESVLSILYKNQQCVIIFSTSSFHS